MQVHIAVKHCPSSDPTNAPAVLIAASEEALVEKVCAAEWIPYTAADVKMEQICDRFSEMAQDDDNGYDGISYEVQEL